MSLQFDYIRSKYPIDADPFTMYGIGTRGGGMSTQALYLAHRRARNETEHDKG